MRNYSWTKTFTIKYPDAFGLRPILTLCKVFKPYLGGEDPELSEVRVKIKEPKKYNFIPRKRDKQANIFEICYDGSEAPDSDKIIGEMSVGGASKVEISLETTKMKRRSARKLRRTIFSEIDDLVDKYCAHKQTRKP